jgi:hypothetical protein
MSELEKASPEERRQMRDKLAALTQDTSQELKKRALSTGTETAASKVDAPLTPQEKLKSILNQPSWKLLQSLLHWGVVWEQVREGKAPSYNEDTQTILLAPFTFFGQSAGTWAALSGHIIPTLMYQIEAYRADEVYARANPMPWLVLQYVAPQLVQYDNGPQNMSLGFDLVRQIKDTNELPIE